MTVTKPTLNYDPDRTCSHAPSHRWERFAERDMDLGQAFRCSACLMVRWAENGS